MSERVLHGPWGGPPSGREARRLGAEALAADQAARLLAQTDFSTPLVLEAGAGTGKTTTLVARILAWCLGAGWERHAERLTARHRELGKRGSPADEEIAAEVLGRVVAITFTEAAAAEMAERAAQWLAELRRTDAAPPPWLVAELPPPGERGRRAAALLATLDHLVVRTIHAFCRGLLAAHPLEARLHPELTVDAEGLRVEEVARETVEVELRRAYRSDAEGDPYVELAARGFGPAHLVEALGVLTQAGLPAEALDADPLAPPRVATLRRRLAAAAAALLPLIEPCAANLSRSKNALRILEGLPPLTRLAAADGCDLTTLLAHLEEAFPDNLVDRLGTWQKGRISNQTESAAFAGVETELAAAAGELRALLRHARRLDPELLALAFRALAPLHRRVRDELRARGVVTFEDLLQETASLLADGPGVAAREGARIDQLLVDEFQDTDRLQCEIVRRLALDGKAENRPGLFLVGDPKQSIYGWRSADLAAYEGFVAQVLAAGGRREVLVENFRSVPAVLAEVERTVEPVMQYEAGLQPVFEPLLPCEDKMDAAGFRGTGEPRRGPVEHWVSWHRDAGDDAARTAKGDADELEARAIADDLRHLHDREGMAWGDAALLLRSTGDLDLYLEALRRRGVPFAVGRDKQYYRRREVIDAAALVRAVLDPGDHLALLTVLRSPAVGVPDAALVPLWNRGLPRLVTELTEPDPRRLDEVAELVRAATREVPRDVPGIERVAGWEASLLAAVEHLSHARAAFRNEPADRFVDALRRLFLIEAGEASRYLGAYRLANLERFFRRLTAALEEGGGDVASVLRALRRSVAEAREAPEGKPGEAGEDAVQVMTIHQAKGLDFAHVYLPQLHRETGGRRPDHAVERVTGEDGETAIEARLFGVPSLGWDRVEARQERVETAERVRLLYVAMTRAEERLVLLGRRDDPPADVEPSRAVHLLHLLAHRRPTPELGAAWQRACRSREQASDGETAERPSAGTAAAATDAAATDDSCFDDTAGVLWRFPDLTAWPAPPPSAADAVPAVDAERVIAGSRELARRCAAAQRHMQRPFSAAASEEAHRRLRQAFEAEDESTGRSSAAASGERAAALAVGTALHRALEELDPVAEPAAELARLRGALHGWLGDELPQAQRPAARAAAEALLDHVAAGPLWRRLRELGDAIVARELPLLVAAEAVPEKVPGTAQKARRQREDQEGGTSSGGLSGGPREGAAAPPVAFLSGTVDLLYRDPADGRLVVVDYKTDDVSDEASLAARVAVYAPQGRTYARAVATAFAVAEPPRVELWFLRPGRVATVDPSPAPPAAPAPARPAPPAAGRARPSDAPTPRRPPASDQLSLFDDD